MTKEEALARIKKELVPPDYSPWPFNRNKQESHLDCMRTIMATYIYRRSVNMWSDAGVDFREHLYVSEIDETTGTLHHERGDHCHILKRIATHTRELRYPALSPEAFDLAMRSPDTGLTYAALVGARKQSVHDAEALLSDSVAAFLRQSGYKVDADYVNVISNWHKASDGRGISQLQRSRFNYDMLNFLLDDYMPWHRENYNFNLIDINR